MVERRRIDYPSKQASSLMDKALEAINFIYPEEKKPPPAPPQGGQKTA
jgi:hypothetical protein